MYSISGRITIIYHKNTTFLLFLYSLQIKSPDRAFPLKTNLIDTSNFDKLALQTSSEHEKEFYFASPCDLNVLNVSKFRPILVGFKHNFSVKTAKENLPSIYLY